MENESMLSAGNTSEEVCLEAKCFNLLKNIIDGQADIEDEIFFLSHIEECESCYKEYHLEKTIKSLLLQKFEKKPVPSELGDIIRKKIEALK